MEALFAIIIGAIITFLTQKAKKYHISSRIVIAISILFIGFGYAAFQYFLPVTLQKHVIEFCTIAFSSSVVIYEYVLRFISDDKIIQ